MPQAVKPRAGEKNRRWTWALRLIGLALLGYLLYRLNLSQVAHLLGHVDLPLVIVAVFLTVPLIWLKTIRWQIILRAQGVRYGGWSAFLAYFGSLFIGFLTPGRLGEFVKAFHVQRECNVPLPLAVSSVLADRLFDLFALIAVGTLAVLTLSVAGTSVALAVVTLAAVIATLLLLFLNPAAFGFFQRWTVNWGRLGEVLFGPQGWLTEIHRSLRRLTPLSLAVSVALTVLAYAVFFGQNYLLAISLGLEAVHHVGPPRQGRPQHAGSQRQVVQARRAASGQGQVHHVHTAIAPGPAAVAGPVVGRDHHAHLVALGRQRPGQRHDPPAGRALGMEGERGQHRHAHGHHSGVLNARLAPLLLSNTSTCWGSTHRSTGSPTRT